MATKRQRVDKTARVAKIKEWIILGIPTDKIYELSKSIKFRWDVSNRTIDNYIADAKDLLAEDAKRNYKSVEFNRAKATERFDLIYAEAMRQKDLQAAIRAESERIKVLRVLEQTDAQENQGDNWEQTAEFIRKQQEAREKALGEVVEGRNPLDYT